MRPVSAGCLIALPLLAAIAGCTLPTPATESVLVANLRFSPSAFDSFRRNTEIQYSLKSPAQVSISIIRRSDAGPDESVRRLCNCLFETKGVHSHTWLGDSDEGHFAPPGEYVGVVEAEGHHFEAVVRIFHY